MPSTPFLPTADRPSRRRAPNPLLWATVLVALTAAAASAKENRRSAGPLGPCPEPSPAPDALCGEIPVPEDPGEPDGRTIGLNVVVLPALSGGGASDAMTFLAGGGVSPATALAPAFARLIPRIREHRDVVLVDQRGTGSSNPLRCSAAEALPRSTPPEERTRRCLEEVRAFADPRFYDTATAMDDLERVREALGIGQWSIWGTGYGTKAARVYLRRHPESVRAVVLHGVVPLATSMWPDLWVSAQDALDALLSRCAVDDECAATWPDASTALPSLLARLDEEPVAVALPPGPSGPAEERIVLDRRSVGRALAGALRSTLAAGSLPSILQAADDGNLVPVAELLREPTGPSPIPLGVALSIACSEELARLDPKAAPSGASRLDDGRWLADEHAACRGWPTAEVPETFWTEAPSDVPVLVLSGAADAVTPPRYGATVAAALGNARHIVLPDRSHDDIDPCVADIAQDLLLTADLARPDLGCLRRPVSSFRAAPGTEAAPGSSAGSGR